MSAGAFALPNIRRNLHQTFALTRFFCEPNMMDRFKEKTKHLIYPYFKGSKVEKEIENCLLPIAQNDSGTGKRISPPVPIGTDRTLDWNSREVVPLCFYAWN
ncbi:hypothetical protein AAC387_Pa08g1680 [Persea americana]